MVTELRPNHRTLGRHPSLAGRPYALAANSGTCRCGNEVEKDDPIVCLGSQVDQDADGTRRVDLTATEWVCQTAAHSAEGMA